MSVGDKFPFRVGVNVEVRQRCHAVDRHVEDPATRGRAINLSVQQGDEITPVGHRELIGYGGAVGFRLVNWLQGA